MPRDHSMAQLGPTLLKKLEPLVLLLRRRDLVPSIDLEVAPRLLETRLWATLQSAKAAAARCAPHTHTDMHTHSFKMKIVATFARVPNHVGEWRVGVVASSSFPTAVNKNAFDKTPHGTGHGTPEIQKSPSTTSGDKGAAIARQLTMTSKRCSRGERERRRPSTSGSERSMRDATRPRRTLGGLRRGGGSALQHLNPQGPHPARFRAYHQGKQSRDARLWPQKPQESCTKIVPMLAVGMDPRLKHAAGLPFRACSRQPYMSEAVTDSGRPEIIEYCMLGGARFRQRSHQAQSSNRQREPRCHGAHGLAHRVDNCTSGSPTSSPDCYSRLLSSLGSIGAFSAGGICDQQHRRGNPSLWEGGLVALPRGLLAATSICCEPPHPSPTPGRPAPP